MALLLTDSGASSCSSSFCAASTGDVTAEVPLGGVGLAGAGRGGGTIAGRSRAGGGWMKNAAGGGCGRAGAGGNTGGTTAGGAGGGTATTGGAEAGAAAGVVPGGGWLGAPTCPSCAGRCFSGVVPHGRRTLPACTVTGSDAAYPPA